VTPPLFFVPADRLAGERVVLDGAEGRHAATVRRLGVGQRVDLADGSGLLCRCVVAAVGRDRLELEVRSRVLSPPAQPRLVVVQALPKGDRGELAVELMTEVGVDVVIPWAAERCMTRWEGARGQRAAQRWHAHAREAAKQSRRPRIPEIGPLAGTAAVAARLAGAALGVVLHGEAERPLTSLEVPATGDVVVVVGPEGGITPDELAAFDAAGAKPARLGPEVLRTSTAGVAALAVLQSRTGRWS
jgi:16S rRNA (uracil1498-N3)-methyltransferase